jgi:hypothetical protein
MMTRQNPFKKRSVNTYLVQLKFGLLVAALMIVILLLTSYSNGYGQSFKCSYKKNEMDKFKGTRLIMTKDFFIGKNENGSLSASIFKIDTVYMLLLNPIGRSLGCVTDKSNCHFKEVSTNVVSTLTHYGKIDCGRTIYAGGGSSHLNPTMWVILDRKNRDMAIDMIRLEYEGYANYDIKDQQIITKMCQCADAAVLK